MTADISIYTPRSRFKDLTGQRFGKLVAIRISGSVKDNLVWECSCDCGGRTTSQTRHLVRGKKKSCGCLGIGRPTEHGMRGHPVFTSWKGMKRRCLKPNDEKYPMYGGRGITVCERWMKFKNFKEDMFISWFEGGSIERIDNNGNYCPENCRWATNKEQSSNRRSNVMIQYQGQEMTMLQWCEKLGLKYGKIRQRLRIRKWSVERAFTEP